MRHSRRGALRRESLLRAQSAPALAPYVPDNSGMEGASFLAALDNAADAKIKVVQTSLFQTDAPVAGTLYMVSVPIGCAEDITLRALRILRAAALIICENVAVTRQLTEQYQAAGRLIRYAPHSEYFVREEWTNILLAGDSIAFVCDAGTPGIADPGMRLVQAALRRNLSVVAIPGPAAVLTALVAAGLPAGRFVFEGFAPRSRAERAAFFLNLAREERAIVLYESGAWLRVTLKSLHGALGASRQIAVACRLTQSGETWNRGTLEAVCASFARRRNSGEYTLVIESRPANSRAGEKLREPEP